MDLNSTILGQIIAFMLFVWFCMKYIWPNLIIVITQRKQMIYKEMKNIQEEKKKIKNMYYQVKDEINTAKKKANNIIQHANKEKILILETAKVDAYKEKEKIILEAKKIIKIQEIELRKKLTKEISTLATLMANKIILNTIKKNENYNMKNIIDNV